MNIKLAKTLANEALDSNGGISADRLAAVCAYVENSQAGDERKIALLRKIRDLLEPISAGQTVMVESSGKLDESATRKLAEFVEKSTGKKGLKFEYSENPALLGGVRIKCGDTIWERSAQLDLSQI